MRGEAVAIVAVAGLASVAAMQGRGSAAIRDFHAKSLVQDQPIKGFIYQDPNLPLVRIQWDDTSVDITVRDLIDCGGYFASEHGHPSTRFLPGGEESVNEIEIKRINRFVSFVNSNKFPIKIYRGIFLDQDDDFDPYYKETQYWSASQESALRFMRAGMSAGHPRGQLITAYLEHPSMVAWKDTMDFFLTYSLFNEPECEIVIKDDKWDQNGSIVRVQEVRLRNDIVDRARLASKQPARGPRSERGPGGRKNPFADL